MSTSDIVLPETKPETEWVRGRPLQKANPTRSHSMLQGRFCTVLAEWAGSRGDVGPEWRFRVRPPGEFARPLVPDVVYVSGERLRGLTGDDLEVPYLSPDVVVEILSPEDDRADVDDKIATYLRAGSSLVIVVDPQTRTAELHDSEKCAVLTEGDVITHAVLPGFNLSLTDAFSTLRPPFGSGPRV